MAETEDFKSMILSFRVSELQVLLGFAGRNKSGRKEQLQGRALELVKIRSAPIQMKIKELYKRRTPTTRSKTDSESSSSHGASKSPSPPPPPQPPPPTTMKSSSQYGSSSSHGHSHGSHGHSSSSSSSSSRHHSSSSQQQHGTTTTPLDYSSKYNLPPSSQQQQQQQSPPVSAYPVHPDVRFRKLPFYQVQAELLKPASLVPSGSSRFQEANFVFHLTPHQAHEIAMSRDLRAGARMEYSTQVQMRFCLLETSCEQEDNFPPSICVKVNGKMCPLPNPIPTSKPGVEPKRPSRPVNVTFLCKLSPTVSNQINVSWASEYGRCYAIAVYLVKRLTSLNLIQRLKSQGARNADHTRALIKEKLAHDADSEIATTSLRVSLMCPLGKMKMLMPSRAVSCTHLQCFDASLYVQMNEKKPTWICPVCDKAAPFDKLIIDGLFVEILNATTDCNEIQFHDNGSWSPMQPKKEPQVIGSPVSHFSPSSSSCSSVASCAPTKPSAAGAAAAAAAAAASKFEVVDLTADDSSDDEPPAKMSRKSPAVECTSSTSSSSSLIVPVSSSSSSSSSTGSGASTLTISSTSSFHAAGRVTAERSANVRTTISGRIGCLSQASSSSSSSTTTTAATSSVYRSDVSVLDTPQMFYPPVASPFADLLQATPSSIFSYPGYDLYSLLGQSELERQHASQYTNSLNLQPATSSSSSQALAPSGSRTAAVTPDSPDVISLD